MKILDKEAGTEERKTGEISYFLRPRISSSFIIPDSVLLFCLQGLLPRQLFDCILHPHPKMVRCRLKLVLVCSSGNNVQYNIGLLCSVLMPNNNVELFTLLVEKTKSCLGK